MVLTGEQLLGVFADYNASIWPMQVVAYLLGVAGLFLSIRKIQSSSRIVPAILAFFWLWVALVFWLPSGQQGFTPGYLFAALFLLQGVVFLFLAWKRVLSFGHQSNFGSWTGIFFTLYAMAGYPLLGIFLGHVYPQTSPFGLTPCPVVAYTFGLLLLTDQRVPKLLLAVPFFYALSGFYWVTIGMAEDIGMILSGLLGVGLLWYRDAKAVSRAPDEAGRTGWSLDLTDRE